MASVRDVGRERRLIPKPSSQRASGGTGVLRRAESSMTIELA
jgi:hypothetical protein